MGQQPCKTGQLYHIYNRGVEKREIFTSQDEYNYFVHGLFAYNSNTPCENTFRSFMSSHEESQTDHERLVEVVAFALMPNHFHLLLFQNTDNGVTDFMHKLGTGYTNWFNDKHDRSGVLFQGTFKRVAITGNEQLLWIPHYIHLNPLPLLIRQQISQTEEHITPFAVLSKYKWSSLADFCGQPRFKSVVNPELVLNEFGGSYPYQRDLENYLDAKHLPDIPLDKDLAIDVDA